LKQLDEAQHSSPKIKQESASLSSKVDLQAIGSDAVASHLDYENWMPRLTNSQLSIINHPIESSIRIVGPAGSGKTLALCMRAMRIAADPTVISAGKKIVVATHSWAMAERIDGILCSLNNGQLPKNIAVFPLLSLLEMHAGNIGNQKINLIGNDSTDGKRKSAKIIQDILLKNSVNNIDLSVWIQEALAASNDSRKRSELIVDIYEEISNVLTASGVAPDDPESKKKYIHGTREDWMPPFPKITPPVSD